jgi:2-amino-4-hydroxy-6-hydroxymethyldihydropteridine diphosphokinase
MPHTVYIALGSNLGDRAASLHSAIQALPPAVQVLAESDIYETPPWGYEAQPAFLNMAIQAETELQPEALLDHLKRLEQELGRRESFRYGPRQIDLDILFYDDLVLNTPRLVIPHPSLPERAFVLVPLNDIAPDLLHPGLHRTVRQLLQGTDREGIHAWMGAARN